MRPLLLALVLLCACDGFSDFEARPVSPTADAGAEKPADAGSPAPQQRPVPDAGTVEQDSAVQPPPDAGTPDAEAVVEQPADAGPRVVPVVTEQQASDVVIPLCAGCHTGLVAHAALPILEAAGHLRVPQETSACDGMPYVVPGHPEQSYLVLALTAESPCEMHAPVEGLTSEKLQLLRDWVSGMAAR